MSFHRLFPPSQRFSLWPFKFLEVLHGSHWFWQPSGWVELLTSSDHCLPLHIGNVNGAFGWGDFLQNRNWYNNNSNCSGSQSLDRRPDVNTIVYMLSAATGIHHSVSKAPVSSVPVIGSINATKALVQTGQVSLQFGILLFAVRLRLCHQCAFDGPCLNKMDAVSFIFCLSDVEVPCRAMLGCVIHVLSLLFCCLVLHEDV